MRAALPVVRRFRQSKDLNEVNQIAQTIGGIFAGGPSVEFGGRIGLRFTQPTPNPIPKDNRGRPLRDVPIQLGDYRIGLQHNDRVEANVSFF